MSMIEIVIFVLLVLGGFFMFVAGLGLLRFRDTLMRMHASTKAGTLGAGLIVLAIALFFATPTATARSVAILVFLVLTAPVAAHLIGRSVYRSTIPLTPTFSKCKTGEETKDIKTRTVLKMRLFPPNQDHT